MPPYLQTMLRKNRRHLPHDDARLCNHLSMAIIAMHKLGRSDEEIREVYDQTMSTRGPTTLVPAALRQGSHPDLGTYRDYAAWQKLFREQVNNKGQNAVIHTALDRLGHGATSAGFHPIIRLAYALIAQDTEEIVAALAYWADAFDATPSLGGGPVRRARPLELLHEIHSTGPRLPLRRGLIDEVISQTACHPDMAGLQGAMVMDSETLPDLARVSAAIYLTQPDIYTLHLVTGTHAVRVIQRHGFDVERLLPSLWTGVASIYAARGAPRLTPPKDIEPRPARWSQLMPPIHESADDHVYKLLFACRDSFEATGEAVYFEAASQAVQPRVPSPAA